MNFSDCKLELSQENLHDLYGFCIIQAVIMLLCSPPTITLNLLVLVGIYKTPSLHSPSNLLLFGLALTDLGAGAIGMPAIAIESISGILDSSTLRCVMKMITSLVVTPFSGISFVTLSFVSLERLLALHFHLRYNLIVTNQRIICCLMVVWITGFILASAHFWFLALLEWSSVLIFGGCLITSTVNNIVVFRILHRHRLAIEHQQQQIQQISTDGKISVANNRKTSRTMLWVYVLFLVCYMPFLAVRVVRNFKGKNTKALYATFEVAFGLMYLNSLLNPILYCIKMQSIRKAMVSVIPEKLRSFLYVSAE